LIESEVSYDSGREDPPSRFRKPAPGMLLRAAAELDLDLTRSWMVGDRWRDVDCGKSAGCRTVFIDGGYSKGCGTNPISPPGPRRRREYHPCATQNPGLSNSTMISLNSLKIQIYADGADQGRHPRSLRQALHSRG